LHRPGKSAPEKAIDAANAWRLAGGGLSARHCLGLAYAAAERWAPAATAFEQAAAEAETARDARRADFWAQAGNAWLAAGDPAKAKRALDSSLVAASASDELRGEVHLDRARAAVALGDAAGARADIDQALKLVPADPYGWLLSSALALKEEKIARAQADIAKASQLAPNDPGRVAAGRHRRRHHRRGRAGARALRQGGPGRSGDGGRESGSGSAGGECRLTSPVRGGGSPQG
jgi:tetratricopeptide (TPR) repeat protein